MFTIKLKKLGKRKIKTISFSIQNQLNTLSDLLKECVKSEVQRFNEQKENPVLISFLSPKEIQEQAELGKISFNDSENDTLVDIDLAVENIIISYKDGLFVVFINDEEIKSLDQTIEIDDESEITFLRLTFLTGTYW